MRLMDLVAVSDRERFGFADGSRRVALRGAGLYAEAIRDCPVRYILSDEVGQLCESLLKTDAGMLEPGNNLLRMPIESFWLEWTREGSLPGEELRRRQRIGCLVNADTSGRSGTLHSFWIDEDGRAQVGQVYLVFDLDHSPSLQGPEFCRVNHAQREFQALLDHVTICIEPEWAPYLRSLTFQQRTVFFEACATRIWFDLPIAFAFTALLQAQSYVTTKGSNLDKLNRNRLARGRPALLEPVETRLWLGQRPTAQDRVGHGRRACPRLHIVRGHMVRRDDAIFWRMTHFRGDPTTAQALKTVKVGYHPSVSGRPRVESAATSFG